MIRSFTLLHGTNLVDSQAVPNSRELLQKLIKITSTHNFVEPTETASQRENCFFSGWEYEILKPENSIENHFFLVIIAPACPGCSPINPFHKIDRNPMFAVNVCNDYFIVWQEGDINSRVKDKFNECKNIQEICVVFENFLAQVA